MPNDPNSKSAALESAVYVDLERIKERARGYSIYAPQKLAWIDEMLQLISLAKQSRKS